MSEFKKYRNKETGEIVEAKYERLTGARLEEDIDIWKIFSNEMMCFREDSNESYRYCCDLDQFKKEYEELEV